MGAVVTAEPGPLREGAGGRRRTENTVTPPAPSGPLTPGGPGPPRRFPVGVVDGCQETLRAGRLPSGKMPSCDEARAQPPDRKSTRLNSSHVAISYAVFGLKKKNRPWDCRPITARS